MTYATFLEEAYQAIRAQAPSVWQLAAMPVWMRAIGEVLLHLPPDLHREWADQYAALLVVKYGHIEPGVAALCVRHGLTEAQAHWPKPVQVAR